VIKQRKKAIIMNMNTLIIFIIRLIIGLVFGIILTRLFKPDWGIYHGIVTGLVLVILAYGMSYYRKFKK